MAIRLLVGFGLGLSAGVTVGRYFALPAEPTSAAPRIPPDPHGISEIRLSRGGCHGSCPRDDLVFRSDGTCTYSGGQYVPKMGAFEGNFIGFDDLAAWVAGQHLERLPGRIDCGMDGPVTSITIVRYGTPHTILVNSCTYLAQAPEFFIVKFVLQGAEHHVRWRPAGAA
jgi:hypothetical protein